MDSLRITAPRTTPPLPYAAPIGGAEPLTPPWNEIRATGMPSWVASLDTFSTRLETLGQRADVDVQWLGDPAGLDPDIALPVVTFGAAQAPAMLVVAGQHGRELAPPVAALDWMEGLLAANDAGDPQARWLLASRQFVVLPASNPRGLAGALEALHQAPDGPPATMDDLEAGATSPFATYMRMRKNQSTDTGGVDLNRNHAGSWTAPPADDPDVVYAEAYMGPTEASEPETRIIDSVLARTRPNVVIDMHQFGNFFLASAGRGQGRAGTARALERLRADTGFAAPRAKDVLRPHEEPALWLGGTMQSAGSARGADLSMTMEMGRSFVTTQDDYEDVRAAAASVLTNLARTSTAPVEELQGPDVSSSARATSTGWNVHVSDARSGSAAIVAAELVTSSVRAPGTGLPLVAADGAFDEPFETVRVPATSAGALVGIRAKDASGHWGPVTAFTLEGADRAR